MNSNRGLNGSLHSGSSQPLTEIIDLTDSPPLHPCNPFHSVSQDVIDVDSLPDYLPPPVPPLTLHGSRRITSSPPRRRAIYLPSEDITRGHDVITLGDDPDPPLPRPPSRTFPSFFNFFRNQFPGSQTTSEGPQHFHYRIHQPPPPPPPSGPFVPPRNLNYALNAHHVYGDDTPLRDHPGFRDEFYQAPSPPRQGFTRSPTEKMALICPDCGDELGKHTNIVKKEVWIAKCGHTYCGGCAARQRQNKGLGVKAGRCIVDGCSRIVSGDKGMMEVFL
jgi:hypothetical protein